MKALPFILALLWAQCTLAQENTALKNELERKDSLLFAIAMGTCNLQQLETVLAKDFILFHDGGYANPTSAQPYEGMVAFIQKTCGNPSVKMRRELVKESVQVFPFGAQEAMQTGVQRFYVRQNGVERQVEESKFTRTWRKEGNEWKIARELDFLVNTQFATETRYQPAPYAPVSETLHNTIARLDSIYFDTYNTCNMEKMAAMMSDTLEFYHDRTGLSTSKQDNLASIRKNICGKVTRELVKGSLEVYPIQGYGAVEIGYHRFRNKAEAGASNPSKFIVLWQQQGGEWKITRVVSLH